MSIKCNSGYKDAIYEHVFSMTSTPGFIGKDREVIQDTKNFVINQILPNYALSETGNVTKKDQENLAQCILDAFEDCFVEVENPKDLKATIVDQWLNSDRLRNKKQQSTSSEQLERLSDEEIYRLSFNEDYMRDAFGGSNKTLLDAKRQAKKMLTRAFIYSSDGIVATTRDLRESVIREQEKLFNTVMDYLRFEYSSNPRITEQGQNILDTLDGMFDESGNYINVIPLVEQVFGKAFEKPDNLFELQVKADGASGFKADDDIRRFIEAYRSWVLLRNFSNLVEDTFGDAVEINKDLDEYDPNRYTIGKAGSNVYSTWRTSDEIFLSDELNNIVQLIITSSPMYAYGNDNPLEDSELRLNDFNYIIGKLKNFAESVNASDTVMFDNMKNSIDKNLSAQTEAIIAKVSSLAELIDKIRINPSKYLPAIFELLSDPVAYDLLITSNKSSDIRLGGFNNNDKNLIYTLYKNFFDRNNPESLIRNQERTGLLEKNYYGYLTQVIDSVFTNKYLQYYRDADGKMRIRGMMGQQLDDISSRIERSIQSKHARAAINYSEYERKYQIKATLENPDQDINQKKLQKIEFDIPLYTLDADGNRNSTGLHAHITVGPDSNVGSFEEKVKLDVLNSNNEIVTISYEDLYKNISHFIEDMLGLDVGSDKFIKSYQTASQSNDYTEMTNNLIGFASRILSRIYVSSNLMYKSDTDKTYIEDKATTRNRVKNVFKLDSRTNVNSFIYPATGELKLVNEKKDLQTIKTLAAAYAYIRDLATSSVIKDGNGNSLSADSLSKLGAAYRTQWVEQNKKDNSATKHYMLFDSNLFMGLFQAKELKDFNSSTSKSHVDFNPAEMLNASLIYDYFDKLTNETGEDHNKVFFLASVNSDKSNIGRLKINLDYNVGNLYKNIVSPINDFLKSITLPFKLELTPSGVQIFNKKCRESGVTAEAIIEEAMQNNSRHKPIPTSENFYFDENGDLIVNPNILDNRTLAELIKDADGESKFREIIRMQLGQFYNNIINGIETDLRKLNSLLPTNAPKLSYSQGSYEAFNLWCKNRNLTPVKYLNELLAKYNYNHPNNIIVFTDQMHIIESKTGEIKVNKTLIELAKTLNSKELTDNYFDNANEQIFRQLLKDDFEISIVGSDTVHSSIESLYSTDAEKDIWINKKNGKLVLGVLSYITPDGQVKTHKITQSIDLMNIAKDLGIDPDSNFQQIKDRVEELYYRAKTQEAMQNGELTTNFNTFKERLKQDGESLVKVTLNPQIAKYNALNYLFTQEWLSSTVGTHMAHPSKASFKNGYSLVEDEASRFNAQHKRNVSFTASMHEFQLNLLNGIPNEYNVSIIREITDELYNIMGLTDDSVSPYDGATFVNPFIVYLENYSLGGAKAGMNKKQFVHYYDEHTGNGGIIKTAGFGLNNLLISDSPQMKIMMHNMSGRKWRLQNDELFNGNVFETYNNNSIYVSKDSPVEGGYFLGDIYYKDNSGRVIKVENIKYLGNNQYEVSRTYVTNENAPDLSAPNIKPEIVTLESNWDLWNLFGAEKSVEYDELSRTFVQSENSIKFVVDMMNRVGIRQSDNIQTQEDVYQFMKHSDIHYMPVDGSVKQGAANMNDSKMWSTDNPEMLNFMKVKMNQAGIQLDKEHNADSEEVSLMTQVISACAQRGYTLGRSTKMYQALASLAKVGIQDQYEALSELYRISNSGTDAEYENQKSKFQETVVDLVFDSLLHQSETSDLVSKIAQKFVQEAKLGRKIQFKSDPGEHNGLDSALPFSIDEIYRKTYSIINVALTRAAIKIKLPGVLSILCPSFNIMKLYDGKLYHEYTDPDTELETIQQQYDANPIWQYQRQYDYTVGESRLGDIGDEFASSNTEEGIKLSREDYDVDEFIDYILNRGQFADNPRSQREFQLFSELFEQTGYEMELEDWVRTIFQTPEDVKNFLIQRSQSNLRNHDSDSYFERDERNLLGEVAEERIDWTRPNKSEIDKRAIIEAISAVAAMKQSNLQTLSLGRTYKVTFNGRPLGFDEEKGEFEGMKAEFDSEDENGFVTLRIFVNNPNQYYTIRENLLTSDNENVFSTQVVENLDTGEFDEVEVPVPTTRIVKISEYIKDGRNLGHYNVIFRGNNNKVYNIFDLDSVKRCYDLEASKGDPALVKEARRSMQRDLFKLHRGEGSVLINNNFVEIAEKMEEIPYEVVMPKTAKTDFGLSTGDNLSEIIEDKDFFTNKILKNYKSKIEYDDSEVYDIELKRLNGDHVYILSKERADDIINDPLYSFMFQRRNIAKLVIDGELWRMDPDTKEKMYKLSPREDINNDENDDRVYTFGDGKVEIIVTDNLEHYLGTQKYTQVAISPMLQATNLDAYNSAKNAIFECADENSENYNEAIHDQLDGLVEGTFETLNKQINELNSSSDLNDPNITFLASKIKRSGAQTHASFRKSLDIIAARIPAQSMQSFMPMKIAAFDNSDRNTAYVSTAQIWLQGSDYDIDAVTLTNFSFDKNGKYITWSPLASISSYEALKASDKLPFPNGKTVVMLSGENSEKVNVPELVINPSDYLDEKGRALRTPEAIERWANLIDHINSYGSVGITGPNLDSIFSIVNNHNLHINTMYRKGGHILEGAVKNYMLTQMYEISIDPVNLPASQQPVDRSTKPLKNRANQREEIVVEQQESTPASFVNAIHSIYENQVGKTGVGICAVGLKSYFATTQAVNQILDEGTYQEKRRCILGRNGEGVTIRGRKYTSFSNAYKQGSDPYNQISEEELNFRYKLKDDVDDLYKRQEKEFYITHNVPEEVGVDERLQMLKDAGITLDNALNTLKPYFEEEFPEQVPLLNTIKAYQDILTPDIELTIGVNNDVDSAVNLSALLSLATDNAKELALAKMNAGTGMLGMYIYGLAIGVSFDEMFDILTSPSALEVSKLMRGNSFTGDRQMMISQVFNYIDKGPVSQLQAFVNNYNDGTGKNDQATTAITNLVIALDNVLKSNSLQNTKGLATLLSKLSNIDVLEDIRKKTTSVAGNQLLDLCERYVKIKSIINSDSQNYSTLKTLADGAEEYRILGQILHVNQGLYTSIPDSLNYLNTFQNLIYNKSKVKADKIDVLRFSLDKDYREEVIQKYEEKAKHTINILQVVSKVPHFLQYLQTAATSDAMMENISAKYRATKRFAEDMIEEYQIRSADGKKTLYRTTDTMVNTIMINDWLLDRNLTFTIKKGDEYYVEGYPLELRTAASDMTIRLGTNSGNATFKRWMERVVIPDLKKGLRHDNGNRRTKAVRDNQFIKDLTLNIYQNTPNYNVVYAYTLPINMSPRSDEEMALFDTYKSEFMKLNNEDFGDYYMPKRSNGEANPIRIIDLFFLYQAIVTQDKAGESNLHSLFNDMQDVKIVKDFYAYVNEFDRNGDVLLSKVPKSYIKDFVIPKGNPYQSAFPQIVYENPEYYGKSVWRLINPSEEDEGQDIGEEDKRIPSAIPGKVYVEDSRRNYASDQVTPRTTSGRAEFTREDGTKVVYNFRQGRLHNSNTVDISEPYTDENGNRKTKGSKVAVLVTEKDGTQYAIKTYGEGSAKPYQISRVLVRRSGRGEWEEVLSSKDLRKYSEVKIPITKREKVADVNSLWIQINNIIHNC